MRSRLMGTLLLASLAGCSDVSSPDQELARYSMVPIVGELTIDEEYREIARRVPGFGGFFFDKNQVPTMYLKNPSGRPFAISWLQHRADTGLGRRVEDASWRVIQADYDYEELSIWFGRVQSLVTSALIGSVDIDEANNRLTVGLIDLARAELLEAGLRNLAIPRAAVRIVPAEQPKPTSSTLRTTFRPIPAGVLVINGFKACTAGANFIWPARNANYFIVASHCTFTNGLVDGDNFYQPDVPDGLIGVEEFDAPYLPQSRFVWGQCAAGWECKNSDAALIRFVPNSQMEWARIARTTAACAWSFCTVNINATNPRFIVNGTTNMASVGEALNKMGQKTGWTQGLVTKTCQTHYLYENGVPTYRGLVCQGAIGGALSDIGDSGGPIFKQNGSYANIHGVQWGLSINTNETLYSPKRGVVRDYGITQDGQWLFN